MRNGMFVAVLGLSLAGAMPLALQAADAPTAQKDQGEVKVELKDCPQAVQDTIKKEAGSGTITEVTKDTEDGKLVYSAEVKIRAVAKSFRI